MLLCVDVKIPCFFEDSLFIRLTSHHLRMQPDSISSSKLEAWAMDDSSEDQRLPHR